MIYERLTEVEKMQLRRSTDDGLLWLWQEIYRHDPRFYGLDEVAGLTEMKALQAQASDVFNNSNTGFGLTWKF